MVNKQISIGQIKRDISQLVNRVAYGGERIILTSRGKPKAALVSMEDYEKLQTQQPAKQERMMTWMEQTKALADDILKKRKGKTVNVDDIIANDRRELENRSDWLTHRN